MHARLPPRAGMTRAGKLCLGPPASPACLVRGAPVASRVLYCHARLVPERRPGRQVVSCTGRKAAVSRVTMRGTSPRA